MIRAMFAVAAAGAGQVTQLLAQAGGSPSSAEVTSWVSAGGTTIVVGALAYIARLLASGHLVAYPVEKLQEDAGKREKDLEEALKRAHEREKSYERILLGRVSGGDDES